MTRAPKVTVSGNHNEVIAVGRDLVVTDTYVQQKPVFYEPSLEQFSPPNFISPQITPRLVQTVHRQHLLVLGGSPAIDKSALARHIVTISCRREGGVEIISSYHPGSHGREKNFFVGYPRG